MRDESPTLLAAGASVLPQRCGPGVQRRLRLAISFVFAMLLLHASASASWANPLSEYQRRVQQAVTALDTLSQADEDESEPERSARIKETIAAVRSTLPESEKVEWDGTDLKVDNSWLHRELEKFEHVAQAERASSLALITERLQAIAQRLAEIQGARIRTTTKVDERKKLAEILQRPEYAASRKERSALSRLLRDLLNWLQNLFPKPKPMAPGSAGLLTLFAQIVVILLALGVIAYAIKLFAPSLLHKRGTKKKGQKAPRIVLGEKLDPDQSAVDLLADAEALARRGELRAAIRKAYIALLVELGERKIISLAQHKTNRDYLSAVRNLEPLYGNIKQLTDSFVLCAL